MNKIFPAALCALLCFLTPAIHAQTEGRWSLAEDMPTERKDIANSVVRLDGKIYVIGGISSNGFMSDKVEAYTPATD